MSRNRTSLRTGRQPELFLPVARGGGILHQQIERALRDAIRAGRLRRGAPVPSTRALASDLGVSRGVVVEAYEQLVAEGFLAARRGSKTIVAAGVASQSTARAEPAAARPVCDFRPGVPDLSHFPREAWLRAARRVMRDITPDELAYVDPRGTLELRAALAAYLGRVRHVNAEPASILVCNGFAHALGVVARVLRRRGVRRLAVEDPGHPDTRRLVRAAGLEPIAVPVDDRGLDVTALARSGAEAALVTPAHQSPAGVVLAPERRQELIAWAERGGRFVLEDDYDAEYRYDRAPVGALQALAPERVLYAGSASKVLAPGLRLGWLVVPPGLAALATDEKLDLGSPTIDQRIYAELLERGEIDRHLRRMRVLYRRRRDVLVDALARHLPDWEPRGIAAGLHLLVRLPRGVGERDVERAAAGRSVRVYPMADYRSRRGPPELVLGYAGLGETQIRSGVARLAAALSR